MQKVSERLRPSFSCVLSFPVSFFLKDVSLFAVFGLGGIFIWFVYNTFVRMTRRKFDAEMEGCLR